MQDRKTRPFVTLFDGDTEVTEYQDSDSIEADEPGHKWLSYGLLHAAIKMREGDGSDWLLKVAKAAVEIEIDTGHSFDGYRIDKIRAIHKALCEFFE